MQEKKPGEKSCWQPDEARQSSTWEDMLTVWSWKVLKGLQGAP